MVDEFLRETALEIGDEGKPGGAPYHVADEHALVKMRVEDVRPELPHRRRHRRDEQTIEERTIPARAEWIRRHSRQRRRSMRPDARHVVAGGVGGDLRLDAETPQDPNLFEDADVAAAIAEERRWRNGEDARHGRRSRAGHS